MTSRPIDCDTPCNRHGPRGCTVIEREDRRRDEVVAWLESTGNVADVESRRLAVDAVACPLGPLAGRGR